MSDGRDAGRATLPLLLAAAFPVVVVVILAPQAVTQAFDASGYMPHGHCYLWQPTLLAIHGVSDLLIGFAYLSISLTLAYLVYQARDHIPFQWMLVAFGLFIIACGVTHFMEVITLWTPLYWVAGDVKVITAIASVGTAVALPPLVPRILELVRAEERAERSQSELVAHSALLAQEQAARAKAEEADRAKDQFLALVSHELRNPLSPILAWARMLKLGTLEPEKQAAAVDAIVRNASAQAQLVEDLLDVSRIVSGKLRLDVRPTALGPVIEAAAETLRPSADAKNIRIQLILDPRPGMVLGDADRLRQVVWNLLSNAIKFTPKGGRVQISLERVNSHIELSVSDTGQGIASEALPRVFERFWQAEAGTDRRHGGLGLGLCIVRHLVESHGGEVQAYSDGPGRGALFRVKLPLMVTIEHIKEPDRRHPIAPEAPVGSSLARLAGISVLVVDDEPDANELVQTILTSCGAEVRVAASTRQALAILDVWHPNIIISDIGMPQEDGYALIGQLRQRQPERGGETPAVALTAYARVEDRVKIFTAGFQMHVMKPVDPTELVAVVASLARSASRRSVIEGTWRRDGDPGTPSRT
jgi:signal transduction histidine kinase/ActR/RegA family two-component response regulator